MLSLPSSAGGPLERLLLGDTSRQHRPVSVCIVDEASQCVEPECLIPLRLGGTKLVLVGDHEQLPATVTCRRAQQCGYQQSLFGRMVAKGGHVWRLDTQYRFATTEVRFVELT